MSDQLLRQQTTTTTESTNPAEKFQPRPINHHREDFTQCATDSEKQVMLSTKMYGFVGSAL